MSVGNRHNTIGNREQNIAPTKKHGVRFSLFIVLLFTLFATDLGVGSVNISLSDIWLAVTNRLEDTTLRTVIIDIRLIKCIVALLAGAALSVSGLLMQTMFRNPLAGPYVLGLSAGASLGVAIVVMAGVGSALGTAGAAWLGTASVLFLTVLVSRRIRDIMVILILGIMFSSAASAIVQVLQYLSSQESLKSYVIWTMGSLGEVTERELYIMVPAIILGLLLSLMAVKPLNLLLFGEEYACTMGLDLWKSRILILVATTLLAGSVTAFCGPIGFVGLAMPHVARFLFKDSNNRVMVPASAICGASALLLCDIISKQFALPINSITSLLGIPIVIWVVIRARR